MNKKLFSQYDAEIECNLEALKQVAETLPPGRQKPLHVIYGNLRNILDNLRRAPAHNGDKHKQKEEIQKLKTELEQHGLDNTLLQALMTNIPDGIYFKDKESRFLRINHAQAHRFGLSDPSQAIGKTDFDFFTEEHARPAYEDEQNIIRTGQPIIGKEEEETWPDGRKGWVSTTKMPIRDNDGKIVGTFGLSRDITEQVHAEEELLLADEKLKLWIYDLERHNQEAKLLRQMSDLLQICNSPDEAYLVVGQFGSQLFPVTSGALYILNNSRRVLNAMTIWGESLQSEQIFTPEDCWALRRGQPHLINTTQTGLNCEHMAATFQGSYLDVPMMAAGELLGLLHIENHNQELNEKDIQELAQSVTEHLSLSLSNVRLRETLRAQSIRDPLTGLYNRRYMEESLERELHRAERKKSPVGVIMLDIDHFKRFNDTYGHNAGDAVLRELGALLQHNIRGEDIACRFGGEEFLLILPDTTLEVTEQRARHIRTMVKDMTVEYRHQSLGAITMSFGIAVYPDHGMTTEGILGKADEALYQAKHKGRDRVEKASFIN